jgi:hypothetical protein
MTAIRDHFAVALKHSLLTWELFATSGGIFQSGNPVILAVLQLLA